MKSFTIIILSKNCTATNKLFILKETISDKKDVTIEDEDFSGFVPVADVGDLSPYSSTSVNWDDKWTIKPEILLGGENIATNGTVYINCPDLSLLTTNMVFIFQKLYYGDSAIACLYMSSNAAPNLKFRRQHRTKCDAGGMVAKATKPNRTF